MEEPILIGVVHASRLLREGLNDLLNRQAGFRVSGSFSDARQVLEHPLEREHVLLYDLGTARQDGAEGIMDLHGRLPQAKILMFNVVDDDQTIVECVRVGASGCTLQDASLEEILEAVRAVWRGTPVMSPRCITSLFAYVARLQAGEDSPSSIRLTGREEQILGLLAEGLSNKEIAQKLYLQPQTVKNYVHLILQKLDMHSRFEVIRLLRSGKH